MSRLSGKTALVTGGALLFGVGYWMAPLAAGIAFVGLAIGHVLTRLFYERKLGGYTGDTLGAVQQTSEIGFYLGLLAWL